MNRADTLLASAIKVLTSEQTTFHVKPWREIMKNSAAEAKAKDVKAAAKKVSQRVKPYKHGEPDTPQSVGTTFGTFAESQLTKGVDSPAPAVVESKFQQPTGVPNMTKPTQEEREAAAKAKMEAKAAKIAAAAEAKAKREADKAEKAAAAQADKERKAAEKAAARAEKAAAEPAGVDMSALSEKVKAGIYVKGKNGQLRSNDEIALAMEVVPAKQTVAILLKALALPENPYSALNYGQQSMNLRNRLRGAVRKGTVTIEALKVSIEAELAAAPASVGA